jgi:hypothetical protein
MEFSLNAYVGILVSGGAILCIIAVCIPLVRFKEARVRRLIGDLEWLSLNGPVQQQHETRSAWNRVQPVFELSLSRYLKIVWDTSIRDLFWANRFGVELRRLSLFPLPYQGAREGNFEGEGERERAVMTHISDLFVIARRVFPEARRRERSEE